MLAYSYVSLCLPHPIVRDWKLSGQMFIKATLFPIIIPSVTTVIPIFKNLKVRVKRIDIISYSIKQNKDICNFLLLNHKPNARDYKTNEVKNILRKQIY